VNVNFAKELDQKNIKNEQKLEKRETENQKIRRKKRSNPFKKKQSDIYLIKIE